ncbi:hypothetical protein AB0I54_43850 [Streptomyces sp. NPDC050625]|uniref:hypothetical protein n=1 Tax=Streptomyces sp. NPDC050625 TaxID=3154629 RepID=UPI00342C5A4A
MQHPVVHPGIGFSDPATVTTHPGGSGVKAVLEPNADNHLADFIADQHAVKAGAVVFACLLHLADDACGAHFWWRFAAGAGHEDAEYCLFLHHAHSGE